MSYERRKIRVGRVVSDKMDQTVTVVFEWRRNHALYKKSVRRRTRFKAHDPSNECKIGDLVRIIEGRPYSKTKRWKVLEILEHEEIAELQPEEIVVEDPSVLTARAAETRMGSGKGAVDHWVAVVKTGRIMFEIAGVPEDIAREALRLASSKLPIHTTVVTRQGI